MVVAARLAHARRRSGRARAIVGRFLEFEDGAGLYPHVPLEMRMPAVSYVALRLIMEIATRPPVRRSTPGPRPTLFGFVV